MVQTTKFKLKKTEELLQDEVMTSTVVIDVWKVVLIMAGSLEIG